MTGWQSRMYIRENIFFPLTSDQACFKNRYRNESLDIARKLVGKVLVLPMYAELERQKVTEICGLISRVGQG